MATAFTAADYQLMSDEMRESAAAAAGPILAWLQRHASSGWWPRRIVDVGCGPGWWAARLAALGCEVLGVDGPDGGEALRGAGRYLEHDLAAAGELPGRYDVAFCLEVAEHLAPADGAQLVRALTRLAPVVVFSAAVPGQGGVGHINERWQPHWAAMFDECATTAAIRDELWTVEGLAPYYPQNLFVAWRAGVIVPPSRPVDAVVHPGVWAHINDRRGAHWP